MKSDLTNVPWPNVSAFVRQLAHDIRNDLNALELEIALLPEQNHDGNAPDQVFSGLRSSVRNSVTRLRLISARVDDITIHPTPIPITDLVEVTREKIRKLHPADSHLEWDFPVQSGSLEADISLLADALTEIVSNAIDFSEGSSTMPGELSLHQIARYVMPAGFPLLRLSMMFIKYVIVRGIVVKP